MNVLTVSRLFPNPEQPNRGVFVADRVARLAGRRHDDFRVLAPVAASLPARMPASERRGPSIVEHPRFWSVPKLGFPFAAWLLYRSLVRHVERLLAGGYRFDLVDAHFCYPDGVAGVWLGRRFGKPVVITARGSDLNLQAELPVIGGMIRRALADADGVITVSQALAQRALELGASRAQLAVLRNGVDLERFRPLPREPLRRALGLTRTTLLSVGNLVPLKGHDRVVRAMLELPDAELLVIGAGPEERSLRSLIERLGLSGRARLLGAVAHERMAQYFGAADLLVLASSHEGWPNVLLEAMACGTPVVATRVGGVPEIVASDAAGVIVDGREPAAIADGVRRLLARGAPRDAVRRHAERFAWDEVVDRQLELFDRIVARRRAAA